MKVHIISRSTWHEPPRIRQQLARLLTSKYDVVYHSPKAEPSRFLQEIPGNLELRQFPFLRKWGSLPIITFINSICLYAYLKINVKKGDVVFSFLPEILWWPYGRRILRCIMINDDFASMAPTFAKSWIRFLLKRMARKADHSFYVSTKLQQYYPGKNCHLFYPWCDARLPIRDHRSQKKIILYWGYISVALDLKLIESMASDLLVMKSDLKIWLVGPIDQNLISPIKGLCEKYSSISYHDPIGLEDLPTQDVIFGLEPIALDFHNSSVLEFPNKAPRLLASGIPLVYSGCDLLEAPYLIKYDGNLPRLIENINNDRDVILDNIARYLEINNSNSRLKLLDCIFQNRTV